jgi:hypothetical protein
VPQTDRINGISDVARRLDPVSPADGARQRPDLGAAKVAATCSNMRTRISPKSRPSPWHQSSHYNAPGDIPLLLRREANYEIDAFDLKLP